MAKIRPARPLWPKSIGDLWSRRHAPEICRAPSANSPADRIALDTALHGMECARLSAETAERTTANHGYLQSPHR